MNKTPLKILISILSVIVLFWLLLYSNFLANYQNIITLRNYYFNNLDKITPKGLFIYQIRPISADSVNGYIYKFPGRFQSIDTVNSIIVLKDLRGQVWQFDYNQLTSILDNDFKKLDIIETLIDKKVISNKTKPLTLDEIKPNEKTNKYFQKNDVVVLLWNDKRNLTEIKNAQSSREVIELTKITINNTPIWQINKIIW